MGVNDYGGPGQSLNAPSLSSWAASVAAVVNADDTTVNARIAAAVAALGATYLTPAAAAAVLAPAPTVAPPAGFTFGHLTIPKIQRLGSGRFQMTLDLEAMRPAAGVTYYVAAAGVDTNTGLTVGSPISLGGAIAKADVGTIMFAPGEYARDTHAYGAAITKSINYLAAGPGVIVTGWNKLLAWTLTSGSIYQATRTGVSQIMDVTTRTTWGDFTPYVKVANLAAITGPGMWAQVGSLVHVWCLGNTDLTVSANRSQIRLGVTATTGILASAGTSYVRGIEFQGCDDGGCKATGTAQILAEDCTFRYSLNNAGVGASGAATGFIARRCEVSSNAADGFNYHNGGDFIEVDCRSHHNGNTAGALTNNASTSHETCRGIRVGGDYDFAGGPVVADVNSARTWNLGCRAGKSLAVPAQDQSWRVDSTSFEGDPATMWLDECTSDSSTFAYQATGTGGTIYVSGCRPRNPSTVDATYTTGHIDAYVPA